MTTCSVRVTAGDRASFLVAGDSHQLPFKRKHEIGIQSPQSLFGIPNAKKHLDLARHSGTNTTAAAQIHCEEATSSVALIRYQSVLWNG